MRQSSPGHVGHMQEAVDSAEVHERAIVSQILYDAGEHCAFLQMLQNLGALFVLLLLQKLLAGGDDIAALFVELDDGDVETLTFQGIEVADRTKLDLRAG